MKTFVLSANKGYDQYHAVITAPTKALAESAFKDRLSNERGGPWELTLRAEVDTTTPNVAWIEFTGK